MPDAGAAYVPVDWLVRPDVGGFGLADVSYCNANLRNHPGGYELQMYGETIEGEAMDDVTVIGVVTFTICDVRQDNAVV